MGLFQFLKRFVVLGLLAAWLVLLAVPVAEAFDNGHESPDSSNHSIEKIFQISALTPNIEVAQGQLPLSDWLLYSLGSSSCPINREMAQGRFFYQVVGEPPGSPGSSFLKAFSNFRI